MIRAIVLAAGRSRRMGTQKLLLPFAGKNVIAHIVDQLLESAVDGVSVVVGADAGRVTAALEGRAVTLILNPDPDSEMLSSVRCGFAQLPPECGAALIALGDQPSVNPELINKLIAEFQTGGRGIVVPVHDNHRGHPMIIASRYRDEILSSCHDTGLRGLLNAHSDEVLRVHVSTPAVLDDMDYPQDYQRELAKLNSTAS